MCVWQSLTANVKSCEPTFVKTCKNELQRTSVQQSIFPRKKRNALLSKLQINLTTIREEEEEEEKEEEEKGRRRRRRRRRKGKKKKRKKEDQRGHFNQRCVQICVECN